MWPTLRLLSGVNKGRKLSLSLVPIAHGIMRVIHHQDKGGPALPRSGSCVMFFLFRKTGEASWNLWIGS